MSLFVWIMKTERKHKLCVLYLAMAYIKRDIFWARPRDHLQFQVANTMHNTPGHWHSYQTKVQISNKEDNSTVTFLCCINKHKTQQMRKIALYLIYRVYLKCSDNFHERVFHIQIKFL
jgi:hypothetical protein